MSSMAPGVPKNADPMQNAPSLSVLSLQFEVAEESSPDWPDLVIRVDGRDPFEGSRSGWRGFDPSSMLGEDCPLIPTSSGRRVAVVRCGCGEAGCGSLAPLIVASVDGRRISWLDFRDYVGVFAGPVVDEEIKPDWGRPKDLPDLHFDRDQYLAEVERVRWDRGWETPRRRVARLVGERLRPLNLVLPPNLPFHGAGAAWPDNQGVVISFALWGEGAEEQQFSQKLLKLRSDLAEPEAAAEEMVQALLAVPPERWSETFGYRP
ncbi:hypothetical protein LWF15_19755 [Kineosporia rhizophila]|uniref:hypothetical protein n=1 Tax=Kineosporia rhizophila TaxID=84633 RepID=UPI001E4FE09D|nr:hypothetical protein [Kineosporia rhizophila]MCE0537731.1 hypothetical protein [Kineosporia rhizophila]